MGHRLKENVENSANLRRCAANLESSQLVSVEIYVVLSQVAIQALGYMFAFLL